MHWLVAVSVIVWRSLGLWIDRSHLLQLLPQCAFPGTQSHRAITLAAVLLLATALGAGQSAPGTLPSHKPGNRLASLVQRTWLYLLLIGYRRQRVPDFYRDRAGHRWGCFGWFTLPALGDCLPAQADRAGTGAITGWPSSMLVLGGHLRWVR